jgi:hypothetical protein
MHEITLNTCYDTSMHGYNTQYIIQWVGQMFTIHFSMQNDLLNLGDAFWFQLNWNGVGHNDRMVSAKLFMEVMTLLI